MIILLFVVIFIFVLFRFGSDSGSTTKSTQNDPIYAKMVLMAKVILDLSAGGDVGIFTFLIDSNDIVFIANGSNELWCYRNKPGFPDDALLNKLCNGCTSFEIEWFLKFMDSVQIEADSYSFKATIHVSPRTAPVYLNKLSQHLKNTYPNTHFNISDKGISFYSF